ncbi:hypothetical protein [Streptomyces sp. NPDC048603]|uniref:hypothetical protein n=1 Tax=Streptomyces sp. NPDC048603 TaxID=3365577 RepID=UPI00371E03F6
MTRMPRKQRFAMLALSSALVGSGALLSTGAFAAPARPQPQEVAAVAAGHTGRATGDQDGTGPEVRGVENMPGCTFYDGKVYCEYEPDAPDRPGPTPAPPKPDTSPDGTPDTKPESAKPETLPAPEPQPVPEPPNPDPDKPDTKPAAAEPEILTHEMTLEYRLPELDLI